MKNSLIFCFILLSYSSFGQVFSSAPAAAIPAIGTITRTITVTGVGDIDCSYGLTQVCINVSHTRDEDLDIFLIDPNGVLYELTTDNGGTGDNYIVTCFNATAGTNVTAGTAPFNGTFRPEGVLGLANNGQNADGVWTLQVTDDRSGTGGTLNSWSLTFAATPDCGPTPTAEDCGGGTTVCSDATFTGNSLGDGNINDLTAANDGCLTGEHQSSWYYFEAASDGTYAFTIVTAVDYDFAVWGPLTEIICPPVGAPLRCSYSGNLGNTGLLAGSGDITEGSGGNGFVDPITALDGDIFIIVIDNFTADGTSFDLNWTLTGGASFDCTLLPIELLDFTVVNTGNMNTLEWQTASESNNSHYLIERSTDMKNWTKIAQVAGAGTSSAQTDYKYFDYIISDEILYYKLSQVDFDGTTTELGVESVNAAAGKTVIKVVNLMGQEVADDYEGIKVIIYSDGSYIKTLKEK